MVDQAIGGINMGVEQQIANVKESQNQGSGSESNEYSQMANIISDLDRRLRVLEERYSILRKKMQLTDQNLIESERSFSKELRRFNEDVLEVKRNAVDFDEKTSMFSGELSNIAQKSDLKIIEKYLAMWNPTMFVTRKELREHLKNNKIRLAEDIDENSDE
jgi:hypothetical protein